ncbi:MAG: TetR/AcrR family transcriptional regulator C-terminal domain-containing protein [bacterium]
MTRPASDEALARREGIIAAALELLDEDGFERLSLRRLATHLGMHAPGLYWYIDSKQALTDLMAKAILDHGLAGVRGLAPGQQWDDWLVELACTVRRTLLVRRDGARVVAGAYLLKTQAITPVIELSLEILEGVGFERLVALGGTMTLIRYAIGSVLDEQASPLQGPDAKERLHALPLPDIDVERWPRAADAMRQVFEGKLRDRDRMFGWGATLIVRGMRQTSPSS